MAFRKAVRELVQIFKKQPGGLFNPQFTINDQLGEVTVNFLNVDYLLGTISIEGDGFLFIPTMWDKKITTGRSSGTWQNIRYIDEDGTEKRGDLDFRYFGRREHRFWFTDSM